jgi:hypothetical protein
MSSAEIRFVDPDEVWERAGFQIREKGSEDRPERFGDLHRHPDEDDLDRMTEDWDDA